MSYPTNPPAATILCVEDEPSQLLLRKLLLETQGYTVITAESGEEALELFQRDLVDLVIADYWLPGRLNGVAVAREMKKSKPNVPIIIFSVSPPFPAEIIGIADAWLRKAETEPTDLLYEVEKLLKQSRSRQANDCVA